MPHLCMLAQDYSPNRIKDWPVIVQPKYDGVRVMVHVEVGKVMRMYTRGDKDVTSLQRFIPIFEAMADGQTIRFDGEVYGKNCKDFDRVSGQVRQKHGQAENVRYCLFDVQVAELPLNERHKIIRKCVDNLPTIYVHDIFTPPNMLASCDEGVQECYSIFLENEFEGAMVKDIHGCYEWKRSWAMMKIKPEKTCEVEVLEAIEGLGKHVGRLGTFRCRQADGNEVFVGGGFDDDQRQSLWDQWRIAPHLLIGLIQEVAYQNKTTSGSLRFVKHLRWRNDRSSLHD